MYEESSLDEDDARYVETYFVNYYLKKKKRKKLCPSFAEFEKQQKGKHVCIFLIEEKQLCFFFFSSFLIKKLYVDVWRK